MAQENKKPVTKRLKEAFDRARDRANEWADEAAAALFPQPQRARVPVRVAPDITDARGRIIRR